MFKKTIISEFFTSVSLIQFIETIYSMTIAIIFIRTWKQKEKLKNKILKYLNINNSKAYVFYNWRTAIYQCIKKINLDNDSEVIINWYNCVSVANAVLQTGLKIVYSDIDKEDLSFNIKLLEKNINKKTKIIIVQHSFWKSAKIEKIKDICLKNNIILIEDIAHSLWSEYNNKKLWTFWDFAIISSWRDKVISSVNWWILIVNNDKFFKDFEDIENNLEKPSINIIFKNLNYNILWYIAYKTYDILNIWKIIISLSRKLGLIVEILDDDEKNCKYTKLNYSLANSMAFLANRELERIDFYNEHRIKIANIYNKNIDTSLQIFKQDINEKNIYFRYPILCETKKDMEKIYKIARKNKIIFGNSWSWINIAPKWTNLSNSKYKNNCPIAEDIADRILFLPNSKHMQEKDINKILIYIFKK